MVCIPIEDRHWIDRIMKRIATQCRGRHKTAGRDIRYRSSTAVTRRKFVGRSSVLLLTEKRWKHYLLLHTKTIHPTTQNSPTGEEHLHHLIATKL